MVTTAVAREPAGFIWAIASEVAGQIHEGQSITVQAAAAFAMDGTKAALGKLNAVLGPRDCNKWTIATYLPFLWRPETHMFLKPQVTKDFAERVGHPFFSLYKSQLEFSVYESLLDLADRPLE